VRHQNIALQVKKVTAPYLVWGRANQPTLSGDTQP
jgi:hypothetical protein